MLVSVGPYPNLELIFITESDMYVHLIALSTLLFCAHELLMRGSFWLTISFLFHPQNLWPGILLEYILLLTSMNG